MADDPFFRASLGQWELAVTVEGDDLDVSVIDGPDQASVRLPRDTALNLVDFLESWRAGWFLSEDEGEEQAGADGQRPEDHPTQGVLRG